MWRDLKSNPHCKFPRERDNRSALYQLNRPATPSARSFVPLSPHALESLPWSLRQMASSASWNESRPKLRLFRAGSGSADEEEGEL